MSAPQNGETSVASGSHVLQIRSDMHQGRLEQTARHTVKHILVADPLFLPYGNLMHVSTGLQYQCQVPRKCTTEVELSAMSAKSGRVHSHGLQSHMYRAGLPRPCHDYLATSGNLTMHDYVREIHWTLALPLMDLALPCESALLAALPCTAGRACRLTVLMRCALKCSFKALMWPAW